jgi:hypothetical protein
MAGLDPAIHAMTVRLNCPATSPAGLSRSFPRKQTRAEGEFCGQ